MKEIENNRVALENQRKQNKITEKEFSKRLAESDAKNAAKIKDLERDLANARASIHSGGGGGGCTIL